MSTIIFLPHTKFTQRDYDRYGVEQLRNRNFNVEIWDAILLFFPEASLLTAQLGQLTAKLKYRNFNSRTALLTAIIASDPGSTIFVPLFPCTQKSYVVFDALNKGSFRYLKINCGCIPRVPRSLFVFLINFNLIRFLTNQVNKALSRKFFKPTHLLTATTCLSDQYKYTIPAHNFDYDIYLNIKNTRPVSPFDSFAVFIDTGEADFNHPDLRVNRIGRLIQGKHYYPDLCSYFDYFEQKYSLKVVIAGHPRVRYDENPYGGREVVYGATARLIRSSQVVLMHYTTAINFAVLFRKPIIFVEFNSHYRISVNKQYPSVLRKSLGSKKFVVMGKSLTYDIPRKELFSIDESAYQAYEDKYIKVPGSPCKNTWDICIDALQLMEAR